MMRFGIAMVLASCLGTTAPARAAAPAEGDDAAYVRSVAGRVAAHVKAGRYEQALAVLDDAERERPHAVFVYVRATVEERRGDCERAAALYLRFLELDVPEDDAEDARRGVARCRAESSDTEAPTDAGSEGAGSEGAGPPGTTDAPPPRRWFTDPWGGVLVASGVVGMGVGAGLIVSGHADARATATATTLQSFDDLSRRAVALDRAGIVTLALGSALIAGGIVRYALVGTRDRRRMAVVPGSLRRGGIVRVGVWF